MLKNWLAKFSGYWIRRTKGENFSRTSSMKSSIQISGAIYQGQEKISFQGPTKLNSRKKRNGHHSVLTHYYFKRRKNKFKSNSQLFHHIGKKRMENAWLWLLPLFVSKTFKQKFKQNKYLSYILPLPPKYRNPKHEIY